MSDDKILDLEEGERTFGIVFTNPSHLITFIR